MNREINLRVRFFSKNNGGRDVLAPNLLSSKLYRPHLVVEQSLPVKGQRLTNMGPPERYLGIAFNSQQETLVPDKDIDATALLMYENVDYSMLICGAVVSIREGNMIVGRGIIG